MPLSTRRDIPFNYTSADDAQIVRFLMGEDVWYAVEKLYFRKVSGRLIRLMLRFIGDLFVIHRNPYVFQRILDGSAQRNRFFQAVRQDIDTFERNTADSPEGRTIARACRAAFAELLDRVSKTEDSRRRLQQRLGKWVGMENVRFDPFTLAAHATDATNWRLHLPEAVVFPSKADEIPPLVREIAETGRFILPRGAGTGLTGGAVPTGASCVVINVEKLNRILDIGERSCEAPDGQMRTLHFIRLEAGVITEEAMRAASERGLVFATDPTSSWACTIGGNIAENAGGKTAVLWGTAIDNLLGYTIVMPDARVLHVRRRNHPLRKILPEDTVVFDVYDDRYPERPVQEIRLAASEIRTPGLGKDITNKALGGLPGIQKEGCDGIIVEAEFILYPRYPYKRTFCLEFFGEDMEEASRVICDIAAAFPNEGREALMALEHFDEEYVKAIDYQVKAPSREQPKAVLLIDLVGHDPMEIERGEDRLRRVLDPYPDTVMTTAENDREAEKFWQDRKKMGAIARRTHAFKLNEDIVLPLEALADFASFVDLTNGEEDRENQQLAVFQIAAVIETILAEEEGSWKARKAEEAIALTRGALERIALAGRRALREEQHLNELMRGLRTLLSEFPEALQFMETRMREIRSRLIVIGTHMHAGDGNVHVNIPVHANDLEMMSRASEIADAIMARAVELGGVVSGEHGIGITKFKYLSQERLAAFLEYRAGIDPKGRMNPGKLSDPLVPRNSFTPSFSLLGLEARILQFGSLEKLAGSIADCIRCGKCKPNCCFFHPQGHHFYYPRNKNLALAALIEAVLYETQRSHQTRFEALRYLKEIADHCTICHKCLAPCPVQIDTGEISVQERRILREVAGIPVHPVTGLVLTYLESRSRSTNRLLRKTLIEWGSGVQRTLHRLIRVLPLPAETASLPGFDYLKAPLPPATVGTLADGMPLRRFNQMVLLEPEKTFSPAVLYFPGCGSERLNARIGRAAIYVLLQSGYRVLLPPAFLCCGFPAWANARTDMHERIQLRNTIIFSQMGDMFGRGEIAACVVSCGTCREALLRMSVSELLDCPVEDAACWVLRHGWSIRSSGCVLYHRPCHDSTVGQAVPFLEGVIGLRVFSVPNCCSEAGTLATSSPEIAAPLRMRKRRSIERVLLDIEESRRKVPTLLTNCPACIQGLARIEEPHVQARHILEEMALLMGGPNWEKAFWNAIRHSVTLTF
ncbi:MAG: DUF3683 domain-containing protein [Thermodesulfobacteriota bacterium]